MKIYVKVRLGEDWGGYKSGNVLDIFTTKYIELKESGLKINLIGSTHFPTWNIRDEEE